MADTRNFVQLQDLKLAGSGVTATATSFTLTSMKYVDGTNVAMADFGTLGFGVFEPGSEREENFSFTSITQNASGTATIGGVTRGLKFKTPYDQDTALRQAHAGGTLVRISNTAPFYNSLSGKDNDESITGVWTFVDPSVPRMDTAHTYAAGQEEYFATKRYADSLAIAGAPDMSTTQKGIAEEATQAEVDARTAAGGTGARLAVNPTTIRSLREHDFAASSAASDAYVITVMPTISAYTDGDVFTFEADVANTGNATLNVNSVGAKNILKYGNVTLADGDIKAGSIVQVVYDADSDTFMLQTPIARPQVSQDGAEVYAADAEASDTYVITVTPAPSAYVTGQVFRFRANTANTGAATLNVNSLGAKTIVKNNNETLADNDIKANQLVEVIYDGTNFQLLSPTAQPWLINPRTTLELYDDFVSGNTETGEIGSLNWISANIAGTSTFSVQNGLTNHPGVFRIATGVNDNDGGMIALGTTSGTGRPFIATQGSLYMAFFLKLDDVTQMGCFVGLGDQQTTFGAGSVNCVGILIDTDLNANWRGVTNDGGVTPSFTSTTVAPTANYVRLEIVGNAAGTSFEFFVDGTSLGTLTTDIPASSAALELIVQYVTRQAASRTLDIDAMYYRTTNLSR